MPPVGDYARTTMFLRLTILVNLVPITPNQTSKTLFSLHGESLWARLFFILDGEKGMNAAFRKPASSWAVSICTFVLVNHVDWAPVRYKPAVVAGCSSKAAFNQDWTRRQSPKDRFKRPSLLDCRPVLYLKSSELKNLSGSRSRGVRTGPIRIDACAWLICRWLCPTRQVGQIALEWTSESYNFVTWQCREGSWDLGYWIEKWASARDIRSVWCSCE